MRATRLLGSVALSAGLLVTGCSSNVPRSAGAAVPVTASPAPSATRSSARPDPATPTTSATRAPSRAAPSASRTASRTFGPAGYGALRLGMTAEQADATGVIDSWDRADGPACSSANLKGAPADQGTVTVSPRVGVAAIDAHGDLRTPEGIRIGSTRSAMRRAYPDWKLVYEPGQGADGRGIAEVPGNSEAYYRIVTARGKVSELTLQAKNQDCYE